jgi:fluoride ion exporter CrcB/FEX
LAQQCARQEFFMLGHLWVSLGDATGSSGRFWISELIASHFGQTVPYLKPAVKGALLVRN